MNDEPTRKITRNGETISNGGSLPDDSPRQIGNYRLLELLVALRWKTDDDIGAQGYPWYLTAYLGDKLAVVLYGIAPPHCFQYVIVA